MFVCIWDVDAVACVCGSRCVVFVASADVVGSSVSADLVVFVAFGASWGSFVSGAWSRSSASGRPRRSFEQAQCLRLGMSYVRLRLAIVQMAMSAMMTRTAPVIGSHRPSVVLGFATWVVGTSGVGVVELGVAAAVVAVGLAVSGLAAGRWRLGRRPG